MKQRLAVLGSTGSIGVQTLDVVGAHRDMFEITVLTARRNWQMLARQAVEFDADCVVIADESLYDALSEALSATDVKVYAGAQAMEEVVRGSNVDVVVNALVGYAGLLPTVAAVETGKKVALANKETLVVGGELSCGLRPRTVRRSCRSTPNIRRYSSAWRANTLPCGG